MHAVEARLTQGCCAQDIPATSNVARFVRLVKSLVPSWTDPSAQL